MKRLALALLLVLPLACPAQWERIDGNIGLDDTYIIHIPVFQDGYVFVTALVGIELRLFRSADDGTTWEEMTNFPGYRLPPNLFQSVDGRLIMASLPGDASAALFVHSDDNGQTWTETEAPGVASPGFIGKVDNTWFAGTANLMARSTDDGQTWQNIESGPVAAGGIVGAKGGILCVNSTGFLLRSDDNGASWTHISLDDGPPGQSFVTGTWRHGSTLYVKRNIADIYASDDGGQTWTIQPTFNSFVFLSVLQAPSGNPWFPFTPLSSDELIYRSDDKGASASGITTGFPRNIQDAPCTPAFTISESSVIAGANCFNENSGLYRFRYSGSTSVNGKPGAISLELEAPWPNPVQGKTLNLPFLLKQPCKVHVTVADALGRRLLAQTQSFGTAGAQFLNIDVSGLPAGSYVVSVISGSSRMQRSVVVVR